MAKQKQAIYVVDDDMMQREMLTDHLSSMKGYEIISFSTGEECLAAMKARKPAILFLDYNLDSNVKNAMDGLEVLQEVKKLSPETEVVMISGQDKIEVAVNSIKFGAFDYIVKGEGAFYRAEKSVFNIYRYHKLEGSAKSYKRLMIIFGIGMLLMIILVLILQSKGLITNNPGWS